MDEQKKTCYTCKHCKRVHEFSDAGYGHMEADCALSDERYGKIPHKGCEKWEAQDEVR